MAESPASYTQTELTSSQHTTEIFAQPRLLHHYSQSVEMEPA